MHKCCNVADWLTKDSDPATKQAILSVVKAPPTTIGMGRPVALVECGHAIDPQISHCVNKACGFMSNPSHEVNAYAKHIALHLYQYPVAVKWVRALGCSKV